MPELKSCPFCGGEAEFRDAPPFDDVIEWQVSCTKCFARTWYEYTQDEAAKAWNGRVGEYEA